MLTGTSRVLWEKEEEVASERTVWEACQVQPHLGRHPRQREVTAFILAVKKFMKTCPVIEMAGVQPMPCRCS